MFWDKIRLQSMHREILDNENGSHTSVIHLVHYLFVAVSTSIMFIMFIKYVALPSTFLRRDKSSGSNSNAGKMDQTWSYMAHYFR